MMQGVTQWMAAVLQPLRCELAERAIAASRVPIPAAFQSSLAPRFEEGLQLVRITLRA